MQEDTSTHSTKETYIDDEPTVINLGDGTTPDEMSEKGNISRKKGGFLFTLVIFFTVLMFAAGAAVYAYLEGWLPVKKETAPKINVLPETMTTPAPAPEKVYTDVFPQGVAGNLSNGSVSYRWDMTANTDELDMSVSSDSREKYTQLKGNGEDSVTVMIYMCGSDLESDNAMALHDLNEMKKAQIGDNVNVLVLTGGCRRWRNRSISSDNLQLYQIKDGEMLLVEQNMGYTAMTDQATLSYFLSYCGWKYPADRNILILWGSGGATLGGYGYDEQFPEKGSLTADELDTALSTAKMKFDIIGFDAPLMASIDNAMVLSKYADYMIASEEAQPETGWYYTDWLSLLSSRPSLKTVLLGKEIIDDSIEHSAGAATLSLIDLARLSSSVPYRMRSFAFSLIEMLNNDEFASVSNARSTAKEFFRGIDTDQIDLAHFAHFIGNYEGRKLNDELLSSVKYNRTSEDVCNAYGLSIYFPHHNIDRSEEIKAIYDRAKLDEMYPKFVEAYTAMLYAGRTSASYDSYTAYIALLGQISDSDVYGAGKQTGYSAVLSALQERLKVDTRYDELLLDVEKAAAYINANRFFPTQLMWNSKDGENSLDLTDDNWENVQKLMRGMFYDNGNGFIELGLENSFRFKADDTLSGDGSGKWITVNGQTAAYYHVETVYNGNKYYVTGRIPIICNNERAELVVRFDNANPNGYIIGMYYDYEADETGTAPKKLSKVRNGLRIDLICGYYSYGGSYVDDYKLGERIVVDGKLHVGKDRVSNSRNAFVSYCFTDAYGQNYWTPVITD